jgi:hypothetical protein
MDWDEIDVIETEAISLSNKEIKIEISIKWKFQTILLILFVLFFCFCTCILQSNGTDLSGCWHVDYDNLTLNLRSQASTNDVHFVSLDKLSMRVTTNQYKIT